MSTESLLAEQKIDHYAVTAFRNEADRDYIAARMSYRAGLGSQFLWSSLQSIEKYLKFILLAQRVKARSLGHDLIQALKKARRSTPFEIDFINPDCENFIEYLNKVAASRYGDLSKYTMWEHLEVLDSTVWSIRRYCQLLPFEDVHEGRVRALKIQSIEDAKNGQPHTFKIFPPGVLESALDEKNSYERDALVWQNQYFGNPEEQLPRFARSQSTYTLLDFDENLYKALKPYIFFSGSVKELYEPKEKK